MPARAVPSNFRYRLCRSKAEMGRKRRNLPAPRPGPSEPVALSGYRIVWVFVLFDLPVGTKKERKAATKFRHALLDLGFEMTQFSVYLKFCAGKEQGEALARQVEGAMAPSGKVHLVQITDKQYENIRTYRGKKREPAPKTPTSLRFFSGWSPLYPSSDERKRP